MKYLRPKLFLSALICIILLVSIPFVVSARVDNQAWNKHPSIHHVLLISVDGLHAVDLARYVRVYPHSTLAALSSDGVTYTNATTSRPSDSFPGILSMTTGGTPRSTGVFYDASYDRKLSPPGSNCATVGTPVFYDESIDFDSTKIDGGGGINPAALPLDPSKGCTPVYPHSFLRVNTIFEVAREAGLRTAWSDKHPAYDLLNGPSGKGVEDLYNPEIASVPVETVPTEAYDSLKVQAILNEIDGKDHTGTKTVGMPAIFGMNFQAVSVAQKSATGGYTDALGTPSPELQGALNFVDQSLGRFVQELRAQKQLSSTTIIITAKHGQTPIDRSKSLIVDDSIIPALVNAVAPKLLAQATEDDIALLWLNDQSKTSAVVKQLLANKAKAHIKDVLSGDQISDLYRNPLKDSRTPDIIVLPVTGVIYAGPKATKIAEHGGFNRDDTHVALLVSNPGIEAEHISDSVATTQIAPTILQLLELNPHALQAVREEHTKLLPDIKLD
ncbi:MAG TPA: alkaline phosphatase family protein [Ktedonobacteraceae bacterium]